MPRPEKELDILERISQILSSGLELYEVFTRATTLLCDEMHIEISVLNLLDPSTDALRTVTSVGLTPEEQARGVYKRGEGITGRVFATNQPAIIADVTKHPAFLNRTKKLDPGKTMAFICVPLHDGNSVVGTVSGMMPFVSQARLQADARLITIVSGALSQTYRLHQLVQTQRDQWLDEKQTLVGTLRDRYKFDNIIGSSPAIHDVLATVAQVAPSRATVLVLGETGCGKELIARAIHFNSPRRDKPLIRVNCGALAPQLLESELFGHVQGAFTGAMRDKMGRFEAADGGTLFLDEVGTLDAQLQVKLLRVLQEREFERVGDHRPVKVDVRVIAATNLDLQEEVRKGNFREDLFYRLNVVMLTLPPLRSRREDIPCLVDHFLDRYNRENGKKLRSISREVLNAILRYPWPGNVRELENAVERAVVLSTGDEFAEGLLPLQVRLFAQQTRAVTSDETLEMLSGRLAQAAARQLASQEGQIHPRVIGEVEKHLIRAALEHTGGVKSQAADWLGINRNTLNKKCSELGV